MDSTVQRRLEHALRAALKNRDTAAVSAFRSALSAIANAAAVPAPAARARHASQYLAGTVEGLGAAEASKWQ